MSVATTLAVLGATHGGNWTTTDSDENDDAEPDAAGHLRESNHAS